MSYGLPIFSLFAYLMLSAAWAVPKGIVLKDGIARPLADGTWMLGEYQSKKPAQVELSPEAKLVSCRWQGKVCGRPPWILELKQNLTQAQGMRKLVVRYSLAGQRLSFVLDALSPLFPELDIVGKPVLNRSLVFSISQLRNNNRKDCHLFVLNTQGQLDFYRQLELPCGDFRPHLTTEGLFYSYQEVRDSILLVAFLGPRVVLDANFNFVRRIEEANDGHEFILLTPDHWIGLELELDRLKNGMAYFNKRFRERKNGKIVFEWGVADYFADRKSEAVAEAFTANYKGSPVADMLHINALQIVSENEWLVSFGSSIGLLDKKTRRLRWVLGGISDEFKLKPEQIPIFMHTPYFDAKKNQLYVFANRSLGFGVPHPARVLRYTLDPENKVLKEFRILRDEKEVAYLMGSLEVHDDVLSIGLGTKDRAQHDFVEMKDGKMTWGLNLRLPRQIIYRFYRAPI